MRDILEELGLNYQSHSLDDSHVEYCVENYVNKKEAFHDSLDVVRVAFQLRQEAVPVKTFVNCNITPDYIHGTVTDQFIFWQEIKDFIKANENDNWVFSHFVKGGVDLNTDPYEDYEDLYESITVYAWIKSDDQPTTEDQENAIRQVRMCEKDLIFAKKSLERFLK